MAGDEHGVMRLLSGARRRRPAAQPVPAEPSSPSAGAARSAGHVWSIGDFHCGLDTDLGGQERALELFVPWHVPVGIGPEPGFVLRSLVDPDALARVRHHALTRPQDEILEVFARETLLHHYRLDDGRHLWSQSSHRTHAFVRDGDEVTVLLAADDPDLCTHAVRAHRELYMRTREEAGGVLMHAAACGTTDGAALVVGGQGAGKTTLMLSACLSTGAGYLGNDRVVLGAAGSGWELASFPLACRIHPGTAGSFPALADLMLDPAPLVRPQHELFRRGIGDLAEITRLASSRTKIELATLEMREVLGIPPLDTAPLRCVLLPAMSGDLAEPVAVKLAPADVLAELVAQCMTPREEKWTTPWLVPRTRSADEMAGDAAALLAAVAHGVPCYRLRFGYGEYASRRAGELMGDLIRGPWR